MSWIKIEHCTPDKPEVANMAALLDIDQDAVVGKLLRLWIWADLNSLSGSALSVTKSFLDRITFQPGFADALEKVAWLIPDEDGWQLPNFDRHNGETAKKRALGNRRMAKLRSKRHPGDADVTQAKSPKASPEKRREDKKDSPPSGGGDGAEGSGDIPLCSIAQARAAVEQAGMDPEIGETWWHDCDSRGWSDPRSGRPIQRWRSALTAYARKWKSNEDSRSRGSPGKGKAKPKAAGEHSKPGEFF